MNSKNLKYLWPWIFFSLRHILEIVCHSRLCQRDKFNNQEDFLPHSSYPWNILSVFCSGHNFMLILNWKLSMLIVESSADQKMHGGYVFSFGKPWFGSLNSIAIAATFRSATLSKFHNTAFKYQQTTYWCFRECLHRAIKPAKLYATLT